ncbi:LexA family protein [Pseudomonas sp. NPDC078416]|uniref:LexA family protein n=1 Tax=Pseudomonas sp. NPDC078416 TaxID=3390637 RepID=UPI003D041C4B
MPKNELTQVQAETLAFITRYIAQNGYSPTYAEIAKAEKVNVNAIGERVAALIKKGAVTKADGIARSIRPVVQA